MANSQGFLSASSLDFDTIKSNLKTFLQSQTAFQDYDFEGSNLNVLLDLLAYNSYMNGVYLNQAASEMFLDTAQLRASIVSHAKELNYTPRSRAGSKANVEIVITAGDAPGSITIPKDYRLTTTVGSNTYDFLVPSQIVVKPSNGIYTTGEITISEGKAVVEYYTANATLNSNGFVEYDTRFVIQSANIDISTLTVDVAEGGQFSEFAAGTSEQYTQANSLFGLTSTSRSFFIQGYRDNYFEVVFGNGTNGRALNAGEIVRIRYHDVVGSEADGAFTFAKTAAIDGYGTVTVTTRSAAKNGADRESNASIKYNAVRHFQTQDRAVTSSDYVNLILAKFPEVQAAIAYGGEEDQLYGKVIISVKPNGTSAVASTTLKNQIIDYLKLKNLTTEPVVQDPDYFYIQATCNVIYDPNTATKSETQLQSEVSDAIVAFDTSVLGNFGKDLHSSKVSTAVDAVDDSIASNDLDLNIVKRWSPAVGQTEQLSFSFDNALHTHSPAFTYPEGHLGSLRSSAFSYISGGTTYTAFFRDNGLGNVHIYTLNADGTRSYLANNVGTVNYAQGNVAISANIAGYTGSYINIIGDLSGKTVFANRKSFLIISAADVTVNMSEVD